MPSAPANQPPEEVPPPEPTVEEMEQATEGLSTALKAVIITLILMKLAPSFDSDDSDLIDVKLRRVVKLWARWTNESLGASWANDEYQQARRVQEIRSFLDSWTSDHASTLRARHNKNNGADTPLSVRKKDVAEWAEDASYGAAARIASETILDLEKTTGGVYEKNGKQVKLKKVWITRSDDRVRPLHRKLHGVAKNVGDPFKTWLNGDRLQYPGDPKAPFDQTIGCRCFLWFTWGK